MMQEKALGDMVNFTGRIPDQQLLEILSTADVCVNPDKPCEMNDISTMIKIMEYMALSKPIVQFDLKEGRFSAGDAPSMPTTKIKFRISRLRSFGYSIIPRNAKHGRIRPQEGWRGAGLGIFSRTFACGVSEGSSSERVGKARICLKPAFFLEEKNPLARRLTHPLSFRAVERCSMVRVFATSPAFVGVSFDRMAGSASPDLWLPAYGNYYVPAGCSFAERRGVLSC